MYNSRKEKIDKYTRLFEILISQNRVYHNHKETMAHAALAIQLAITTWIVSKNSWPPEWINDYFFSAKTLSCIGYILIWILTHFFLRWQLQNRRHSAIIQTSYISMLKKWIITPPTVDDLIPYDGTKGSKKNRFYKLTLKGIDCFFPLSKATLTPDVDEKDYPKCFVEEWKLRIAKGTGAVKAERLLMIASYVMFIIGLLRIILNN